MISWEYAAGFIDGEGHFGVYKHQQRMGVTNLSLEVLLLLQERFDGHGSIQTRPNGVSQYTLGSIALRQYLPVLIPHLILKRQLAELLLEYIGPIPIRRTGFDYHPTDDELARRRRIRDRVSAINQSRGRLAYSHARGV